MIEDNNIDPVKLALPFDGVSASQRPLAGLVRDIGEWAEARNITAEGGATSYTQVIKLLEEVWEFRNAETEEEAKLEFGDILVVCIQIARLRGLDMVECLDLAYEKIKDRKGTMINGQFVKEQ